MIHQHLQGRAMVAPPAVMDAHLDEDALNAFVEGRLNDTESAPIIKHLVACGYCRHATSQLVRLDSQIGLAPTPTPAASPEEPGRMRRLLEDLASRVLPASDEETVFAYHAPAEDFQRRGEAGTDKDASVEDDESPKPSDPDTPAQ
jgi:hypothetical protein